MHKLKFRITAKSDLLFARLSGERNTVSTYDYIPGTTILGIFAGKYISKYNLGNSANTDENFRKIFLDGVIKFSNCYIIGKNTEYEMYPLPKALNHHKRKSDKFFNYLNDKSSDCIKEENKNISDFKSATGYGIIIEKNIYTKNVSKGLNFHHKRDKSTGSTEKGMIFNYEYIKPGTVFHGELTGSKEYLETLKETIIENEILRAGRSKSAQYGEIILKWNGDISEVIYNEKKTGNTVSRATTLISDLIIYNEYGMPSTDYGDLEKYLKKASGSGDLKVRKMYLYQDNFENYVSHWKLKKPLEACFAKGSCFIIEGIDENKLNEWETNGIGERTGEGFGSIKVDYPDYSIDELTNKTYLNDEVVKPDNDIPNELLKIINSILKKEQRKAAMKLGAADGSLISGWSTSFPGKLWGIFQEKNYIKKDFIDELEILPDIAKSKLNECYIGNLSIKEKLNSFKREYIVFDLDKKLYNILNKQDINIQLESDEILFKEYLKAFLVTARRKVKEVKKKHVNIHTAVERETINNE